MTEQHPAPADFNAHVIAEFRANGGKVGGMFEGAPLVLLTTVGARTGRPHTNPAVRAHDGDRILVFASNAGGPNNPAWYHNLLAQPWVTVEVGTDAVGGAEEGQEGEENGATGGVRTYVAEATPLVGAERDRLFAAQCERDPAFAAYQAGTSRVIPVIALRRIRPEAADPVRNQAIGAFLLRVHDQLRKDLATLRQDVDAYLDAALDASTSSPGTELAVPALSPELARHCLAFCGALHEHHTNEDIAFTDFERQFPALVPALARLRAEHGVVARTLTDLNRLLTDLASVAGSTDIHRLRSELAELADGLAAHFRYEEEQILPFLTGTRTP